LSTAMAHAQRYKMKAEQLGLKNGDIKAVSKNIENGRKPQAAIDARNKEIQTASQKMEKMAQMKVVQTPGGPQF
ncbi:MAG: hypothetical protein MJ067_06375, partial [Oscillospiraceae bacterium]|nr:hypothetical protein [Oscillospiraceae bacterium]